MKRSAKRALAAILSAMLAVSTATATAIPAFAAETQTVSETTPVVTETVSEEAQTVAVATWDELKQALESPIATTVVMTQNIGMPETITEEESTITIAGKKTLDLAGSELNLLRYGMLVCDKPDTDFTLCSTDAENKGVLISDGEWKAGLREREMLYMSDGTFTMLSGSMKGRDPEEVVLCEGGNFILKEAATIRALPNADGAEGVTIRKNGTLTMDGGTISTTADISRALEISDGGTFIMNDGLVTNEGGWGSTLIIRDNSTAEINGGMVLGDGYPATTLGVADNSTVKITGGTIQNQGGSDGYDSSLLSIGSDAKILVEGNAFLNNETCTMFDMNSDSTGSEVILRSGKFGGQAIDVPGIRERLAGGSKLISCNELYYGGTDTELSAFLADAPENARICFCGGAAELSLKRSATVLNETKETGTILNTSDTDITINGETVKPGESLAIAPSVIDLSEAEIEPDSYRHPYTGKEVVPAYLRVELGGKWLVRGVDYEVAGEDNIEVGKAHAVVVPAEGTNFTGQKKVSFVICPPEVQGLKAIKKTQTTLKLTFRAAHGADGYKIYDADTREWLANVTTQNGAEYLRKTITGLNPGERRSYKVRAYKIVNGVKRYGNYCFPYWKSTAK